jgi:hypothetical protein
MGYPTTKPPAGAQINWGHPLAPDVRALLINEGSGSGLRDLVSSRLFTPSSADWRRTINNAGLAIEHTATTNYYDLGALPHLNATVGLFEATVVMGYRKTDATHRACSAFGIENSSRFQVHLPFSDSTVYWDFGDASAGSGRLTAAGLTFGNDRWAFVAGSRGREIWQNGILRASQSGGATVGVSPTTVSMRLNTTANISGDLAEVSFFYIYKRQLSQDGIRQILSAPYSFLVPSA